MQVRNNRWLPLVLSSSAALALWTLAAARGYSWQMLWLPATVAGAAWPRQRQTRLADCLRRLRSAGRHA
jgi:hypothetical protein